MKTLNNGKHLGSLVLKERCGRCFGERANIAAALQVVVMNLVDEGIPRKTLVEWTGGAGFFKSHAADVLNAIFESSRIWPANCQMMNRFI